LGLSTERIARACARRPWVTLGAWILALVLGIGTFASLLDLTTEGEITSDPESEQGYSLIGRHFPPDPGNEYVTELVLVRSRTLNVDDPRFRTKVEDLLGEIRASGSPTTWTASTRAATAPSSPTTGRRR
jgi:RND superfamily putative drug exporter